MFIEIFMLIFSKFYYLLPYAGAVLKVRPLKGHNAQQPTIIAPYFCVFPIIQIHINSRFVRPNPKALA